MAPFTKTQILGNLYYFVIFDIIKKYQVLCNGYGWDRSNRNNAYDRMFNMSKKQLQKIRENPDDYLNKDRRGEFMLEPEGMENTSYIQELPRMESEEIQKYPKKYTGKRW